MDSVDVLFIIPPFHRRNGGGKIFPMGIGYLISSVESKGYSWGVINCTAMIESCYDDDLKVFDKMLRESLKEWNPLLIGVGPCITTQLKAIKVISNVCQNVLPQVPIYAGGPFASIVGQEEIFYNYLKIPYLIKGDGEEAIIDVISTIKAGGNIKQSKCISYSNHSIMNIVMNLDTIPFPYRNEDKADEFSLRRKNAMNSNKKIMPMIASRGCPYGCNYCVSGNMKKSQVPFRKRSYQNVVLEMKYIKREYNIDGIVFYDDCFFSDIKRINEDVKEFCELLKREGLCMEWQIEMRPDFFVLLDTEAVNSLQSAGCVQINLGIEKMSVSGLRFLGKQGNWKGLKQKIEIVKENGIKICATFILGGSNENESDIIELVQDAKKLSLDWAQFSPLFVYPGTPLYNQFFDTNIEWVETVLNDKLPWGEIVYENNYLSKERLIDLVDYAYAEFYKGTSHEKEQMVEDRFNIKGRKG